MSDTYGGPGSAFGGGLDLQSGATGYSGNNSGALPNTPVMPPPDVSPASQPAAPTPPQPPQSNAPTFGAGLANLLPGPHYTPPDPQENALDQSADLLQQRIQRAGQIATNPLAQFFAPEQVQAARAAVPQMTEQLQQIKAQKATIAAGRAQAQSMGLTPDEAPDNATQDDRVQVAMNKALKGDMRSFQGLQAVAPDHAASIAPQVYATVAGHLTNAQTAFDSLSGMENEGQYQAKISQLRQDGTLTDLESLGLKLPPTFDAFNASKASEGLALRNARIATNSMGQQLEDRNTYQPMPKDEAATYDGRLTTAYGDKITNGTWSRNAASNTRGFINNGLATPDALGKGGTLGNADQRTQIEKDFTTAVPDKDLEKYRNFNRIYALATQDASGNQIPSGGAKDPKSGRVNYINDNPNVQQGISEGLASMLRGGTGGATAGLLNIEAGKRGAVQSVFDKIQTAYAGTINTLSADQVRPYLTQLTEQQQRQVLDGLKNYTASSVNDRALGVARRAGALGFGPDALGLGTDEAGDAVNGAIEEGRQAQIARMRPNFQAIGGGDGVLQLGAQRPGASAINYPGAQPYNQLPGAKPLLTPVQQAGQTPGAAQSGATQSGPAPPPTPNGQGGAGPPPPAAPAAASQSSAPSPVTVAGQQVAVALPAGASPAYAQTVQRIETGTSKNPWTTTAGGGLSSAGGAFQAIKGTWDQFKPPGAPARAADATPQQQADFVSNFTAHNATALQTVGLPVNDTNLYVTHNLGTTGGPKLLQADPSADARTVVGEAAARNNPQFFKGRPTVAVALQRYSDAVSAAGAPPAVTAPNQSSPTYQNRFDPAQEAAGIRGQPNALAGVAPAALSTVGGIGGTLIGGPVGGVVGGALGGGAGQALKDYVQGNKQSPAKIAEQAALGGVLGVASEARPVLAAAGRVVGSGAIEAGTTAAQGGNTADVTDAGLRGAGEGLGGEALGRFVSSAGATAYKALSRYTTSAQQELSSQAGKLSEARQVLATEQPKLPGDAGANPKYDAAQQQADDATAAIKDHGQNPDDMVHAYEQATSGVSAGEAAVMRKAAGEKNAVSQGYNQLRQDVQDAGVGAPKANQSLPDGPVSQLRTADNPTGTVEAKFAPDAQNAEMLIKAPAPDWGTKWQQLQNAGSELIQKRMAFLQNGDKPSADAMDNLFKGVRNQQRNAANYVFGPVKGDVVISNLENLDQRYAKVMNATQGMDYSKMQSVLVSGNTPESRALQKNFTAFAGNDPSAMRAFNAMKAGASGNWKSEAQLMIPIIAGEAAANLHGIPTVGAVSALVGGHRLYKLMQGYMNAKVLGQPVKFSDFLQNEIRRSSVPGAVRSAAQRGAVQGDVLNGATQ